MPGAMRTLEANSNAEILMVPLPVICLFRSSEFFPCQDVTRTRELGFLKDAFDTRGVAAFRRPLHSPGKGLGLCHSPHPGDAGRRAIAAEGGALPTRERPPQSRRSGNMQ